ncbi:CLUMA_CG007062, isoform A [Clunio marinus]|uniref:CLUMA_CG007062, isoform A n=1 Tax=Clunio marinus TaxID=568069 RepID=A0A1J1I575_9DIPT|nr:CLUMA_CG007062, isoform A [Clunio marinus]
MQLIAHVVRFDAALQIKDEKGKNTEHYLSGRYRCSLRIVKQQGVNVFNKKRLSSIAEKNIHDLDERRKDCEMINETESWKNLDINMKRDLWYLFYDNQKHASICDTLRDICGNCLVRIAFMFYAVSPHRQQ